MRKLGEQWVEEIDGKKHMLKCVKQKAEISHIEEKIHPCHKCFFQMDDYDCAYPSDDWKCDMEKGTIIKDLCVLNEDGCLPNCWGEYPRIEERLDVHTKEHWFRCITRNNVYCATDSYKTKQQSIDAWNRMA